MSATIITGYTGTRHITPALDASVHRSVFGTGSYILADGNQCAGSMPSINQFKVLSGVVSMQGHAIQISQETLAVDTCATGYARIDLVCVRFSHDNDTLVDSASLVVIKGTEVSGSTTPSAPSYSTGTIDDGATQVDFPMYQITMSGSTVTFEQVATCVSSLSGVGTVYSASASSTISSTDIDTFTTGASISVPAGTYVVTGEWDFYTRSSSGTTNSECQIYDSTSSSTIARQRVFAAANNWNALSCAGIVTLTETSTLVVRGATSIAYTTATTNRINAVRII